MKTDRSVHGSVWVAFALLVLVLLGFSRLRDGSDIWAGWIPARGLLQPDYAERVLQRQAQHDRAGRREREHTVLQDADGRQRDHQQVQHYERRRVGELLRQRMTVCRDAGEPQAVIDEIKHLCALIDEAE